MFERSKPLKVCGALFYLSLISPLFIQCFTISPNFETLEFLYLAVPHQDP